MNNLVSNFANRLSDALRIRNMKPIELSEKTGIDKSKISSYMSGRYKAKQDGIHILSKVLNVDPAWLMGYDVPINSNNVNIEDKSEKFFLCPAPTAHPFKAVAIEDEKIFMGIFSGA